MEDKMEDKNDVNEVAGDSVQWISIREKLPKNKQDIIFYANGNYGHGYYMECDGFHEHGYEITPIVKYWIPLPINGIRINL